MHDLLARVPWSVFEALVKQHNADKHIRKLPTKTQFIALAFGQMAGIAGLRETVTVVNSHEAQLYHLGAKPMKISTLSDANRQRPSVVYETLFEHMAASVHKSLRQELDTLVYLIDSTSLKLNNLSSGWARFSEEVCAAKLHIIHDPDANQPVRAVFSAANVNDITVAQDMPIVPGATYVFDLGYYHFGWWQAMHEKHCRFVTRLKTNTKLTVSSERKVRSDAGVLSDRTGRLPARLAGSRRNPFRDEVREVRVRIDTGKILRVLTNDLDAPAEEIAALYKRRWAIELYFRWIKQTLAIRKFIGTSENAVRTHIFIALIVFLLLRMAHANQTAVTSPLDFVRLARAHLMNRRDITRLRPPKLRRVPKTMPEIPDDPPPWRPPHEFTAPRPLHEGYIHRMRQYEN